MAQVVMCDSCGEITTAPAAKMFLVINPTLDDVDMTPTHRSHRADKEMDLCKPCLDNIVAQKPKMKVLTAEESAQL